MARAIPRRHVVTALALVIASGLGGCLTLSPTVSTNADDSTVFESVSTGEPWAGNRVKASVSLTAEATTTGDVTRLAVIAEDGSDFDAATLESGQTSATLYLPTNQNATITATDAVNGTVVETRSVTTGGKTVL